MPLVTINVWQGLPENQIDQIQQATHACLVKAWGIPDNGGYYLINERPQSRMRIDRTMWGIERFGCSSRNLLCLLVMMFQEV